MARTDLQDLVAKWQNIELRSTEDLKTYSRLCRAIGSEMYLQQHFHASELEARLSRYKGRWYHFGVSSKVKARLVAARLRIGAEGYKAAGVSGVKMIAAFEKHFLDLERQARARTKKARDGGFKVDDDE